MNLVRPKRLQAGDTVGIIAPASRPEKEELKRGIAFLESLGLKVQVGKNVENAYGYLAGDEQERLSDFHEMFRDTAIKAIICARGGYGTGRMVSQIDYEIIKNNPKIFVGYSDITFLHTAILQKTGLVTFHGPMAAIEFGVETPHPLSTKGFLQLFVPESFVYPEAMSPLTSLLDGRAAGPLVGGNLSLLISTLGTPYEIETIGKLLLLEDINEKPRVVDRMLNQLYMSGKLEQASGIIIGDFCNCEADSENSLTLDEVINHYLMLANKPSMKGFKIGHCVPNLMVPLGVNAAMDTFEKKLVIESGVS